MRPALDASAARRYLRAMTRLALPIACQQLTAFLVNLADNVMIGQLGDAAVSGVYMGSQVHLLLQWCLTGITAAVSLLAAQYWGRGDLGAIRRLAGIGFSLGLPLTLLFLVPSFLAPEAVLSLLTREAGVIRECRQYIPLLALSFPFFGVSQLWNSTLRSVEEVRPGMYAALAALGTNVLLNGLLIFGLFGAPALGVRGAAIATLLSRMLECGLLTAYLFRRERLLRLRPCHLRPTDSALWKAFLRCGLPVFAGEVVWALNVMMHNWFMGRYDESAIAAYAMAGLLWEAALIWVVSMESAAAILTGKLIGERRWEELPVYAGSMQVIFLGIGAVTVLGLLAVRRPFLSLYRVSPAARSLADRMLWVLLPAMFASIYEDMTLCGIVKQGGSPGFTLAVDCVCAFGIVLPLSLMVWRLGLPAEVMYAMTVLDQVLKVVPAAWKVNRLDWARDLTAPRQEVKGRP